MTVEVNGSTLEFTHKAAVPAYKQDLLFIKDTITNIIALKNLNKTYRVTYDSIDQIFVVHRENQEKTWNSRCTNMDFIVIIQLIRQWY